MKPLILSFALIIITTHTFSQLNKNQFLAGGKIGFSSSKQGDVDLEGNRTKTSFFEIAPNAGYFIFDKLAVGSGIGFSSYKNNFHNSLKSTHNSISLSPFVRYYALPKKNRVNIFGQFEYDYMRTKSIVKNYGESERPSVFTEDGFNFTAGPVFFINPYIALELSLNYATKKPKDDYCTSGFYTGLGFQIHLGNKKKAE